MVEYWIWLAQLQNLSIEEKQGILSHFSSPKEVYEAPEPILAAILGGKGKKLQTLMARDLTQARAIMEACEQQGIGILTPMDEAYPPQLMDLEDAPLVLYWAGTLPDWEDRPTIGVVGTRHATPYGMEVTGNFCRQMAACGGRVVTGGAAGIDTAAMEHALGQGGCVIGVLGCGIDVVYPVANEKLFKLCKLKGCLLSEYPPGTPGRGWQFLARNRIISGLSQGVLVVEAPVRSGALSTARHARRQGREVYAVPGNLGNPACEGSNGLLEEGGIGATSGWSILRRYADRFPGSIAYQDVPKIVSRAELYRPLMAAGLGSIGGKLEKADKKSIDKEENYTYSVVNKDAPALNPQEQAVLARLESQPQPLDKLLGQLEIPPAQVRQILTRLSLQGLVRMWPGGLVSRK